MTQKYFKPKSLTWWCGFVPLGAAAFLATGDIHGMQQWTDAVQALAGDRDPSELMWAGLALIGVRGALE